MNNDKNSYAIYVIATNYRYFKQFKEELKDCFVEGGYDDLLKMYKDRIIELLDEELNEQS